MSKVQDDEVGDGTTSVTVLAAELLRVSCNIFVFNKKNIEKLVLFKNKLLFKNSS